MEMGKDKFSHPWRASSFTETEYARENKSVPFSTSPFPRTMPEQSQDPIQQPVRPQKDGEILHAVAAALQEHPAVQCAYVYGSTARGCRRPDSDIDLAVAADRVLAAGERWALQESLGYVLQTDVDLVDLRRVTGTILRNAMRGTCILCRDPAVKAELIRKLIYDQEDMQPARRRMMRLRRERFARGH